MKNILVISFALLYLTFSVGLTIVVHTCGGESDTMLATTSVEDPCGCGDEMPSEKCCTTELTTVQLDDEQQASIVMTVQPLTANDVHISTEVDFPLNQNSNISSHVLSYFSPPPNNDLCIDNSVFRI